MATLPSAKFPSTNFNSAVPICTNKLPGSFFNPSEKTIAAESALSASNKLFPQK